VQLSTGAASTVVNSSKYSCQRLQQVQLSAFLSSLSLLTYDKSRVAFVTRQR
jgi:hypothetical protein